MRTNGKSRSDPLDQVEFALGEEQSDPVANVLGDPPPPVASLKELMRRKAPWES